MFRNLFKEKDLKKINNNKTRKRNNNKVIKKIIIKLKIRKIKKSLKIGEITEIRKPQKEKG